MMNFHECLNESEGLSSQSISNEKNEKIKQLLMSIKQKHEKYNRLKPINEKIISANNDPKQLVENILFRKYSLTTECHDNLQASVLFGLSEVNISNEQTSSRKQQSQEGKSLLSFSSHSFGKGLTPTAFNNSSKLLRKRIEVLNDFVSVYKEQKSAKQCLEDCKKLTVQMRELALAQQHHILEAVDAYANGVYILYLEILLLKYTALKEYFTEDKAVVEASYKVRELIDNKLEELKLKENELNKRIEAFNSLKGTTFDYILREYILIYKSIKNKEWTLSSLK